MASISKLFEDFFAVTVFAEIKIICKIIYLMFIFLFSCDIM